MKKNLLEVGMAVAFKFDKAVETGVVAEKGVYQATIARPEYDGVAEKVMVPYKDVLGQADAE